MPLQPGQYIIKNVQSRNVAFIENDNEGFPLRSCASGLYSEKKGKEWDVEILENGNYTILNIDFGSFASSGATPEENDKVLGKNTPYQWVIKQAPWILPPAYIISPCYNKDLYWGLPVVHRHGPPPVLSSISTDRRNYWFFEPVASPMGFPQGGPPLGSISSSSTPSEGTKLPILSNPQLLFDFLRLMFTRICHAESLSIHTYPGVAPAMATAPDITCSIVVWSEIYNTLSELFAFMRQIPYMIKINTSIFIIDLLDNRVNLGSKIWQSWEKVDKYLKYQQRNRPGSRYVEDGDYYIANQDSQLITPEKWRAMIKPGMVLDMGIILRTLSLAITRQCPRCGTLVDGVSPKDRDIQCTFCQCKFRVREETVSAISLAVKPEMHRHIHASNPASSPDITVNSGRQQQRHTSDSKQETHPTSPQASETDNSSDSESDTDLDPEMTEEPMPEEKEKLLFPRIHIIHSILAQEDHCTDIEGDELAKDDLLLDKDAPHLTRGDLPLARDEQSLTKDELRSTSGELPLAKDETLLEAEISSTKVETPMTKDASSLSRDAPPLTKDNPALTRSIPSHSQSRYTLIEGNQSEPPLTKDDFVVVVMGATGTGKSTFVSQVTGKAVGISHGLKSQTTVIQLYSCKLPNTSKRCVLVDAVGFDSIGSDANVLETIAEWLAATYHQKIVLTGLLFLHNITNNRVSGAAIKNLEIFRRLCGDECMNNVVLVTTMWGMVDPEQGRRREAELASNPLYWRPLIMRGAQFCRFQDTKRSGLEILNLFETKKPIPFRIQKEMVDQNLKLRLTAVGQLMREDQETMGWINNVVLSEPRKEKKRRMQQDDVLCVEETGARRAALRKPEKRRNFFEGKYWREIRDAILPAASFH